MCILCRLVTMSWESVCFVFGSRIGSKIQRETLQNSVPNYLQRFVGGKRGIRTPGPSQVNGFQDRRIRPLYHLSY